MGRGGELLVSEKGMLQPCEKKHFSGSRGSRMETGCLLERFHVVQTYFRMLEGEVGSRGQIPVYFENKKK